MKINNSYPCIWPSDIWPWYCMLMISSSMNIFVSMSTKAKSEGLTSAHESVLTNQTRKIGKADWNVDPTRIYAALLLRMNKFNLRFDYK